MDATDICFFVDADSRFMHTITSYLACIPMWSQNVDHWNGT